MFLNRLLGDAISLVKTIQLDLKTPVPSLPKDYTETERILHQMLVENSGVHILDSGDIYGRHWQANRRVKDFRKLPTLNVTVWDDGDVEATINVFHYLRNHLFRDETSAMIDQLLDEEESKDPDASWMEIMRRVAVRLTDEPYTFNTYEDEYNFLSQVLQGMVVEIANEDEANYYVMLQLHNGCDVRGGYTKPRAFRVYDIYDFFTDAKAIYASCKCLTMCYEPYEETGWVNLRTGKKEDNLIPDRWRPQPKKRNAKPWEYQLKCGKCRRIVKFFSRIDV